jgi:hypothetical protein
MEGLMRPMNELADTITLAQRYGITAQEVDSYRTWATDADLVEAACGARAGGISHLTILQAIRDGVTTERLRAMRTLNEG